MKVVDVTNDWKHNEIPQVPKTDVLDFIQHRLGCDRDTAKALYESRAIEVKEPTIVIFKK